MVDPQPQNRVLRAHGALPPAPTAAFFFACRSPAPPQTKKTQKKTVGTAQKEGTLLGSGDSRGDPVL